MGAEWTPDVPKLAAFDEDEWARVERAYAGRLVAYVARRVPDVETRDDVVQEVFLGAVRGIGTFDERFTFEQYLFGICRNRTIDQMRRRRFVGTGADAQSEDEPGALRIEDLVSGDESPSRIVRRTDLEGRGRELLEAALARWVQDTWAAGEFTRLMVVEALFRGGWRNRDTWDRFGLRDETAVAGIKFRALKRLRELVARDDASGDIVPSLAQLAEDGDVPLDVAEVWAGARVSCPARHWLARSVAGTLEEGPAAFVDFHVEEIGCEWCRANRDDLAARSGDALEPFLESIRASTARLLRSRRDPGPSGDATET